MQETSMPSQISSAPTSERIRPGGSLPDFASAVNVHLVDQCRAIQAVVDEMDALVAGKPVPKRSHRREGAASRRAMVQRRQIAMYVSHVVLCHSLTDLGLAFGRDRTTVSHACHVVEDRRDDPAFDRFIASIERVAAAVFQRDGGARGF
jgi:hypothetical protein